MKPAILAAQVRDRIAMMLHAKGHAASAVAVAQMIPGELLARKMRPVRLKRPKKSIKDMSPEEAKREIDRVLRTVYSRPDLEFRWSR